MTALKVVDAMKDVEKKEDILELIRKHCMKTKIVSFLSIRLFLSVV